MSEPIVMPGHGISPEGGNTIGRTFDGESDSGGGDTPSDFDDNLVNLTSVLYCDAETTATTHTGNIERPIALLQDAVDAAANGWTLELAPVVFEPGITVPVQKSGLVLRGIGDALTVGRPSIDGMTLVGGATVVIDGVAFTGAIEGNGSIVATRTPLPTLNVDGGVTATLCTFSGNVSAGGTVHVEQSTFSPGILAFAGDLEIDLFSMDSIRRAGATLQVDGNTTILDAPTVIGDTTSVNGENEIVELSVTHALAQPGDTFAASATGLGTGQGLLAPRCAVAGTVIVPVACIGLTTTSSVTPTVTLLPVATPDTIP